MNEITIRTIQGDIDRLTRAVNMAARAGNVELKDYFLFDLQIKRMQLAEAKKQKGACHDATLQNPVR